MAEVRLKIFIVVSVQKIPIIDVKSSKLIIGSTPGGNQRQQGQKSHCQSTNQSPYFNTRHQNWKILYESLELISF